MTKLEYSGNVTVLFHNLTLKYCHDDAFQVL